MKLFKAAKVLWIIAVAALAISFLLRGLWVGVEGLRGTISLDSRDWMLVTLFLVSGTFMGIAAVRASQRQLSENNKAK